MFFWDPTILILIPALLLAGYAQLKVKSTYAKYAEVGTRSGMTGADVARAILADSGISYAGTTDQAGKGSCGLVSVPGNLTDHYDPTARVLRLSEGVYNGRSVAALGVAAHEVGHAIQHHQGYGPLALRGMMYPLSNFGSSFAWILFIAGFFLQFQPLLQIGIILFSAAVAFTLVTLPVEFDASRRALVALGRGGYLMEEEISGARKVLNAAALTYVAAAVMAVLQLLRMIMLSNSRD